jgi:hypothetical protein
MLALQTIPVVSKPAQESARISRARARVLKRKCGEPIQMKLAISAPGDAYELEADRIADQVMAKSPHSCDDSNHPQIQRFLQQGGGQPEAAPRSVDQTLASPGRLLEPTLRRDMESRFGHDFSRVQVHSGGAAAQSARDINARAYTAGRHIVFDSNYFAPQTHEGLRLIAHELAHVVQQSSGSVNVTRVQRQTPPTPSHPTLEESDRSWIKTFGFRKWLTGTLTGWRDVQAQYASATAETFHPTEQLLMGILTSSQSKLALGEEQIKTELNGDPAVLKELRNGYSSMISVVVPKFASLVGKNPNDVFEAHRREIPEWARPEEDVSSVVTAVEPAAGVQTTGIKYERTDLKDITRQSYWEAKVGNVYFRVQGTTAAARFSSDPEERDAVFSVLWQVRPAKLSGIITKIVTIPSRGNGPGGKPTTPLTYKFTFKPANKNTKNMPSVEYEFLAEGSATMVTAATEPAKAYKPSSLGLTFSGFPVGDINVYWAAHPGEHRQLFNWIENLAPASFEQIVTTSTGKPPTTTSFKVKGTKSNSGIAGLTIDLLGKTAPGTVSAPADYRAKTKTDAGDFALEEQQSKKEDKLGSVKLPSNISASEAAEVKYLIAAYFKAEKAPTRNAEVDVRVPSVDSTGEILYTFRFLANNNVEAIRVGEPAPGTRLDANRLDAGRSREFLNLYKAKDVKGLAAFIAKRYPGLGVVANTVEALRVALNKEINSKAGDASWFQNIYGLTILGSTAAKERLTKKHPNQIKPPEQTADLKDFTQAELFILEATLETLSLSALSRLKGVNLVRQKIAIEKKGKFFTVVKERAGLTLTDGPDTTIIIFDQASINDETLFVGGRLGVLPTTSLTFAHEFGHAVGGQADIQKEFNKFVAAKKIRPITAYARTDSKKEFFPEAFAQFSTDPEWMKANQPELFIWFEELAKTGKPPKP